MTTFYQCRCGWQGSSPDYTDRSYQGCRYVSGDDGGGWMLCTERVHQPVCPRCGEDVVTVREAAARELRGALIDIARSVA